MVRGTKETQSLLSWREMPGGVWALGFVSLFMDISSEMIHALLPLYLVTVLGTSLLTVGVIEGIAEATTAIMKIFSGALSDWLGQRKLLAVVGYGLAAFTKPVFALATSILWIVTARFVDRVGKGIRGAPRDALIADLTPVEIRGAAFGLRQSLDTVGAAIGPLLAIAFMALTASNFAAVFWIAVIPGFISLTLIVLCVHGTGSLGGQIGPLASLPCRIAASRVGLLADRCACDGICACPLQRGVPASACPVSRVVVGASAERYVGHERGLCARRLAGGCPVGQDRSLRSSHKWISGAGISRPHAGVWLQHHHDRHRSGTLGITHGTDPRATCEPRCRYGSS